MSEERFGRTDDELFAISIPLAPDLLKGKVVAVSGAGSGIGRAIAIFAARLGARVAVCGRKPEPLNELAANLQGIGAETFTQALTIRDPSKVHGFFDSVTEGFGGVDVLVNNAGGQFPQLAIDFSVKGWNAVIDTNLNGTWYMMQAAAQRWRDSQRPGNIINIVAVTTRGMPGVAHTCAARAGVIYLSKTVAIEWAPLNIRVNCIAPGIIWTEGMRSYPENVRRNLPQSNLLHRFGHVEDVASAACYIAGPGGAFMTGEVMTIDGGSQIWGDQWTIDPPAGFREQQP